MRFIIIFIILSLPGFFFLKSKLKKSERKKIKKEIFPEKWREILKDNVKIYNYLPKNLQKDLEENILIFLHEKTFEGAKGFKIDDTVKVTVAGQACILLLNRNSRFFSKLKNIIIYPTAFSSKQPDQNGVTKNITRLGESWGNGTVILAWNHVLSDPKKLHDGHNVVFHEFAHQLDQEDGGANGAPILKDRDEYKNWYSVMSNDYKQLKKELKLNIKDVMDFYGATNPAEFFAVATETFFEKPLELKEKHSSLYDELSDFYKVNPIEWFNS